MSPFICALRSEINSSRVNIFFGKQLFNEGCIKKGSLCFISLVGRTDKR